MPTGNEYGEALTKLADIISRSQADIIGQIDGETDEGNNVNGYAFTHGNSMVLQALAVENQESIIVRGIIDVVDGIASGLAEEEQTGDGQPDVQQHHLETAQAQVRQMIENANREDVEETGFNLRRDLCDPAVGFDINDELGAPHRVEVTRELHIYEDDVDLKEFNRSKQAVASVLTKANLYFGKMYNIGGGDSSDTTGAVGPDSGSRTEGSPADRYVH